MNKNNNEIINKSVSLALNAVKFAIIAKISMYENYKEIWNKDIDEQIYIFSTYSDLDKEEYNLVNAYFNLLKLVK